MNNNNNLNIWGYGGDTALLNTIASQILYKNQVSLEETGNLEYSLIVDGETVGTITIPSYVVAATYNSDTKIITLTFETSEGTSDIEINVSDLVDTYEAGNGLSMDGNVFSVAIDGESDSYLTVSEDGIKLIGVEEAISTLQANIDSEAEARESADEELSEKITTVSENLTTLNTNVVTVTETLTTSIANLSSNDESLQSQITSNDEDIAALQEDITTLVASANYDSEDKVINLVAVDDTTILASIDVSDFIKDGMLNTVSYDSETKTLILSFNTDAGKEDVTISLSDLVDTYTMGNGIDITDNIISLVKSESSEDYLSVDEDGIAVTGIDTAIQAAVGEETSAREEADESLTNIDSELEALITSISSKFEVLADKVDSIYKSTLTTIETEEVENEDGTTTATLTSAVATSLDADGSYYVNGASITTTSSDTITASAIVIEDCTLEDDTRLNIVAETVEIDGLTISGDFLKATQNSIISINNASSVVFKDCIFDMSSGYNVAEINLGSSYENLPSIILFDNCQFTGTISNNAISIFGTADNANVTLNECYFESVSNALRISNRTDASGVVFNVINCTVDEWDSSPKYQGFCICQDYTSGSYDASLESNLFAPDKITFSFNNLVHAGEKVTCDDLSTICGVGSDGVTEGQIFYVRNYSTTVPYSEEYYPTITFK